MEKRNIKKVAVLGSGVMGSRIACHFAGIGLPVLLLDIAAPPSREGGIQKTSDKNKIVNDALVSAVKSNPSPVYHKNVIKKITTGNFDDDMKKISDCDWVIEVVIEKLDIKKQVYEKVEQFRKPGTLITSNTSGIPIYMLSENCRSPLVTSCDLPVFVQHDHTINQCIDKFFISGFRFR